MSKNLITKIKEYYYEGKIIFDWNEKTVRFRNNIPEIHNKDDEFIDCVGSLLELVSDISYENPELDNNFRNLVVSSQEEDFLNELLKNFEIVVSVSNNTISTINTEVLTKRSKMQPEKIIKISGGIRLKYKDIDGNPKSISFEVDENEINILMDNLLNLSEQISKIKNIEKV